MSSGIELLGKDVGVPNFQVGRPLLLVNTPEYLCDYICDIISLKSNSPARLRVYQISDHIGIIGNEDVVIVKGEEFKVLKLEDKGYRRVNRVWEEGEYSVLGDVVTLWPSGSREPVRISMWGNQVESIEVIHPDTRLTKEAVESLLIGNSLKSESRVVRSYVSNLGRGGDSTIELLFVRGRFDLDEMSSSYEIFDPGFRTIPGFNFSEGTKQLDILLRSYVGQGYDIFLSSDSDEEIEIGIKLKRIPKVQLLGRGYVDIHEKKVVLTDSEISGSVDLGVEGDYGDIFKKIVPGDYVVHADHGIGVFEGLVEQDGGMYLQVSYAKKDRLLLPLTQSKKIHKYIGSGKGAPVLTGLGGNSWKRIQKKVRADIARVAAELIRISAMREMTKVDVLLKDEDDIKVVREFAKTFLYEDTEDQYVITEEIISDFSRSKPMDRLVVGDVGFGKTEIAMRAAWAAVVGGKQVAFLAPTTILVGQHLAVFKERFEDSGVNIASLSRLQSKAQKEKVLKDVAEGRVDILIGTHALLSDAVKFKDLGLLIVDEEQKFGVKQKEKIKAKRFDVHVLSMTATPIPRTLNMALKGVKEMSVLASVPPGRKPISNHFGPFDWDLVSVAIEREVKRGGQVYFVHNRVSDIEQIKSTLEKNMNGIKFMIVHGQMSSAHLASAMSMFASGEVDVLICTTIIENGIDLPNVNTVIVRGAENFGLSQLYQIRGRVGRSDVQAYAYFLYNSLKGDGEKRLGALKEAKDLGAGFILSNRDLEIRGVGDILGSAQSGAINSVGYAMFSEILQKAVENLRSGGDSLIGA